MEIGDRDRLGRVLKVIRNRMVLVRSEQRLGEAHCETCGKDFDGKNVMGVAAQHAAAHCHKVVVRRELVTEYDGETPNQDRT